MNAFNPHLVLQGLLLLLLPLAGLALDAYPNRPIRMVVPFAPGGAADQTARMVSEGLSKRLGQSVVVDNKPGGGATTGAAFVVNSPADGYTLLYTTPGPQITNPFLMKGRLPYAPNQLLPVSRIAWVPSVLVINPKVPANTVQELITYAQKNPGKIFFGSAGIGATSHLSGELFKRMAQIEITHVPYKGTGQVVQDLLSGNVQMSIDSLSVYLPYIKSGQLKALGIAMPQRSPAMPELPPVSDQIKDFDATPVNYLSVKAGTPSEIVARLNHELVATLADPVLQDRMDKLGLFPKSSTPEAMAQEIITESAKWKRVIEDSGATMD
ncbi:MAG: tripartite tricarboxylate transporter substrate binding protein [Betaproteobacteria bacterium]|jgi:tripartite-type tricarboxylate transporter receptor subunit TctC